MALFEKKKAPQGVPADLVLQMRYDGLSNKTYNGKVLIVTRYSMV
jgi:hypothetical protein